MELEKCLEEWREWRHISGASDNTIYSQGHYISQFIRLLPKKKRFAKCVTPEMVHAHVNKSDGKSANTKRFTLAAVKALFTYAKGKGYCEINPADIVKVNKRTLTHDQREAKERMPFTEKEFNLVIDKMPYFYRQATAISWYTGLRLGDIAKLEWSSMSESHIIVWTDKRDKRVALPMDHIITGMGALRPFLREILRENKHKCFPVSSAVYQDPKCRAGLSLRFKQLVESMGVADKSFHCLRHGFVTRLAQMDMSLEDIGKLVGHTNTETTEGYTHV